MLEQQSIEKHICITVCTRGRPRMLSRLIESFVTLDVPEGARLSLIVVENDSDKKVEAVVHGFRDNHLLPIHYHWEPRLGIPIARNCCVEIAKDLKVSHIAFVDDDEWLPKDWLITIWNYYQKQDPRSAIQGPVISVLPDDKSGHYLPFFQRAIRETGADLHMCMTNNVLVPLSMFHEHNLVFDESRPLAGGSDSKLFRAAKAKGVPLIYCAEAIVYEEVPEDRINIKWLSKRNFRIGLTLGEHAKLDGRGQVLNHSLSKAGGAVKKCSKALLYLVMGKREKHLKYWLRGCKLMGEGMGPLGVKVDSYKTTQGS